MRIGASEVLVADTIGRLQSVEAHMLEVDAGLVDVDSIPETEHFDVVASQSRAWHAVLKAAKKLIFDSGS